MSICITAYDAMPVPRPAQVTVRCDGCGTTLAWSDPPASWGRTAGPEHPWTIANRAGWLMDQQRHLCGDCRRPRRGARQLDLVRWLEAR